MTVQQDIGVAAARLNAEIHELNADWKALVMRKSVVLAKIASASIAVQLRLVDLEAKEATWVSKHPIWALAIALGAIVGSFMLGSWTA